MTTHLTYDLIKDVVEVCATVTADENPFLIDGRYKCSAVEGANSKATKAGRLSSLVVTLIVQELLASVPAATLEKVATTILFVHYKLFFLPDRYGTSQKKRRTTQGTKMDAHEEPPSQVLLLRLKP